jgi:hypothetical protein
VSSSIGRRAFAAALAVACAPRVAWADDAEPEQVRVLAPHREVGETTIRREDTREVPGTFGDPTRFAETLPGVVPTVSALQAFFVRGAPPTATGFFIDGVPVPALYHIGFGPSVIHPALIDHVDFFQGEPPARYGRYVGGVVDATTTQPVESGPHGEGNVRVFDAGAFAETPLADGKATALVAARYGYPAVILPLFSSGTALSYWDYQGRVTYDASSADRITLLAFGSDDRLSQQQTAPGGGTFMQQAVADQFHRGDLRWDHTLGRGATLRVAATIGRDQVGNDVANAIDDITRLRLELDARPSSTVRVHAGADGQLDWLRPAPPPGASITTSMTSAGLVPSRHALVTGAYLDAAWRLTPRIEVVAGVRGDVYVARYDLAGGAANVSPAVDPRLSVRARLVPGITSISTFGVAHQLPGIPAQYPAISGQDLQTGVQENLQSSVAMSQGLELALPASLSLQPTVFLHDYFGLPDVTAPCTQVGQGACITPSVRGQAYGLEVLLRRSLTERFTAWISYTLSRSTRQARGPGMADPTMTVPSEYDRTHVVSAVASYDFGGGWIAGGRVYAYTGRPYTPTSGGQLVPPYDSQRIPGFFRLDARIEKSWTVGERDRISVVLEGVNVTLNQEPVSAACTPTGGPVGGAGMAGQARGLDSCTVQTIGPITIPSIGVEGTFR